MRRIFYFGCLLVLGCGGGNPKPDAAVEPVKTTGTPVPSATPEPTQAKPPVPAVVVHELDAEKHTIPAGSVTGSIKGQPFKPEHAIFRGNTLTFRMGPEVLADLEVSIQFQTSPEQSILPLRVKVNPLKPMLGSELARITVARKTSKDSLPEMTDYADKYAMTLELAARNNGKVKGQIYLALPDTEKSYCAGTFDAVWMRSIGGPLDADEVPYVQGSFTLPAKTDLVRYGYLAETGPMNQVLQCAASINLKELPEGAFIGSSSGDLLGRGDIFGRQVKGEVKFDSSRLTPGRYLFWAKANSGAMAFSWVDITPTSQATVNLVFSQETGSVEAKLPKTFEGKIEVTPFDPKETNLTKEFGVGGFNPTRVEEPVKDGQAVLKGLPPGKYRFRAWKKVEEMRWIADLEETLEVKAGASVVVPTAAKK